MLRSGKAKLTIQNWIQSGYLPTQPKFKGKGHVILASDLDLCVRGKPFEGNKIPKRPWNRRQLEKTKIKRRALKEQAKVTV